MIALKLQHMTLDITSIFYGFSPNERAEEVKRGAYSNFPFSARCNQNCRGCKEFGNQSCPFHSSAMLLLSLYYCPLMAYESQLSPAEKDIAICLKNFGDVFAGFGSAERFLSHGEFEMQKERFKKQKQINVNENVELKTMFMLTGVEVSRNLPIACVYGAFGRNSFFLCFNDGKYFILGANPIEEEIDVEEPIPPVDFYSKFIFDVELMMNRGYLTRDLSLLLPTSAAADDVDTDKKSNDYNNYNVANEQIIDSDGGDDKKEEKNGEKKQEQEEEDADDEEQEKNESKDNNYETVAIVDNDERGWTVVTRQIRKRRDKKQKRNGNEKTKTKKKEGEVEEECKSKRLITKTIVAAAEITTNNRFSVLKNKHC